MLPTSRGSDKTMTESSRPSRTRKLVGFVIVAGMMATTLAAAADENPSVEFNDELPATPGSEASGEGSIGLAALPEGDCAGGEVYDDGVAENGYSGNPGTVGTFDGVMLFTPELHPAGYETVCVALVSLGGPTLDFTIVFWDDDGAGGQPGTLLGQTGTLSVDDLPGGLPCRMYEVDVSQLGVVIPSGSVYMGVRWNPMAFPSRFVCSDESPTTPIHPGFVNLNLGVGWQTIQTVFPGYRALLLRAVQDLTVSADQVGLVDPATGIWHLRGATGEVSSFFYGNPGDFPFAGDWDCDGVDTPGLYRQSDGFVYLRNSNTQGVADIRFFFGNPGDIPLAGDFDGDGCDTVSIYRPSEARIYIINELGANDGGLGAAEFSYLFGNPGDKPFVGDFNGDAVDTIGLHRESTGLVYFRQTHTQGIADSEFFFGDPGDRLVAGDWGLIDDVDTPGLFRPSNATFYFRHTNTQGNADSQFVLGHPPFLPVAGRWGP